jgi:hypothetical protein
MLTAAQYRAKAAEYAELLKAASLPGEVHEFRRLERSYLMRAENEEWMADNRKCVRHFHLRQVAERHGWHVVATYEEAPPLGRGVAAAAPRG